MTRHVLPSVRMEWARALLMVCLAVVAAPQPVRATETAPATTPKATPVPTPPPPAPAAAAPAAPPPQITWSDPEITNARARCATLLQGRAIEAVPEAPIRDGACGAPAPIRLISVGQAPKVTINPPALVTCEMAVAFESWMSGAVQPFAKTHLGAPVNAITTLSSYDCRLAKGRKGANHLSEHARANAIDVGAFTVSDGRTVSVLDGWGPTARDAVATVVQPIAPAAPAAGAGTTPPSSAGGTLKGPAMEGLGTGSGAPAPAAPLDRAGAATADHTSAAAARPRSRGTSARHQDSATAAASPSRSKPPAVAAPKGSAQFLRATHDSACAIFGTTLGPETNEAHRNHFHVDMAERKGRGICE